VKQLTFTLGLKKVVRFLKEMTDDDKRYENGDSMSVSTYSHKQEQIQIQAKPTT
jgi:hypothetical protein